MKTDIKIPLAQQLKEHQDTLALTDMKRLAEFCEDCARAINNGNKLLIFGNGGSAADAQHFAAELVGRYLCERRALPAIALSTDTSALTAIGNDYGFEQVFARQVQALANPGDICVGISTSGSSKNVIEAFKSALQIGASCWMLSSQKADEKAFSEHFKDLITQNLETNAQNLETNARNLQTGAQNLQTSPQLPLPKILKAASSHTPRIQEAHIFFIHSCCYHIDSLIGGAHE